MYGRTSLDRFKKAKSLEPFAVTVNTTPKATTLAAPKAAADPSLSHSYSKPFSQHPQQDPVNSALPDVASSADPSSQVIQVGGGQSSWQPPDWAIEPRPGVYYLEVLKDREVFGRINLDKRRIIFGRQVPNCDFVLDHQSVSRQHAAVVPHRNGSIYVIDLGSAHGTFVANERLTGDTPVELEVGQSIRFAASTRTYVLRKDNAALFPRPPSLAEIDLPPPPDPSDEDAVVAYNTILNRYCLSKADIQSKLVVSGDSSGVRGDNHQSERPAKRIRRLRVAFRDQVGGDLVEVVGISDGADVGTEPGPVGVKEGSLVGKYESLVQSTVIPKWQGQFNARDHSQNQVQSKVKAPPSSEFYGTLSRESSSAEVINSRVYFPLNSDSRQPSSTKTPEQNPPSAKLGNNLFRVYDSNADDDDEDDDLF